MGVFGNFRLWSKRVLTDFNLLRLTFLAHTSIHLPDGFPVSFGAVDAVAVHKFVDDVGNLYIVTEKFVQLVVEG